MRLVLVVVLLQIAALASALPSCRFAWNYTQTDLLTSSSARETYLLSAAYWEGHFHEPYVSYNPKTGYTYVFSFKVFFLFRFFLLIKRRI